MSDVSEEREKKLIRVSKVSHRCTLSGTHHTEYRAKPGQRILEHLDKACVPTPSHFALFLFPDWIFSHHDTVIFLTSLYIQYLNLYQTYFIFDDEAFGLNCKDSQYQSQEWKSLFLIESYGELSNQVWIITLNL